MLYVLIMLERLRHWCTLYHWCSLYFSDAWCDARMQCTCRVWLCYWRRQKKFGGKNRDVENGLWIQMDNLLN